MIEFLNQTFSIVNIIPTGFLVFTLIYWFSVLIGMLDMNFLNVNVDKNISIDKDLSIDKHLSIDKNLQIDKNVSIDKTIDKQIDKNIEKNIDISWFNAVLSFFNLGRVPLMVFLSFWALPMWFISITLNYYLGNSSVLLSLIFLIPNVIVSLLISKALTQPLVRIFDKLDFDEQDDDFEAKLGIAVTNVNDKKPGQIEIKNKGVNIRLNAITLEGKEVLKNSKIMIIQYLEDKDLYLIESFEE